MACGAACEHIVETQVRIQRRWGGGGPDPPGKLQNIGFLSNTCPDTKPSFYVGRSSARQQNAIQMAFR